MLYPETTKGTQKDGLNQSRGPFPENENNVVCGLITFIKVNLGSVCVFVKILALYKDVVNHPYI